MVTYWSWRYSESIFIMAWMLLITFQIDPDDMFRKCLVMICDVLENPKLDQYEVEEEIKSIMGVVLEQYSRECASDNQMEWIAPKLYRTSLAERKLIFILC